MVLVNQPVAAKKGGSGALKMLSKTEQQAMGMSPEARALLDREKRLVLDRMKREERQRIANSFLVPSLVLIAIIPLALSFLLLRRK